MTLIRYQKLKNSASVSASERIRLLVSGFGLQHVLSVDEIVQAITALPTEHIKRLKTIKYDPNKNIAFLLRHQRVGPQLGEYLGSFESIVIYAFADKTEGLHVLFHEIGHHVYFRFISSQMKKKWVTEIYRKEPGVTDLGCRNACEDFAEAYALYVRQPKQLIHFPQKYEFINKLFI